MLRNNDIPDGISASADRWEEALTIAQTEARIICNQRKRWCTQLYMEIASKAIAMLWEEGRLDFSNPGWKSYVKSTTRRTAIRQLNHEDPIQEPADGPWIVLAKPPQESLPRLEFPRPDQVTDSHREWGSAVWQQFEDEKERTLLAWSETLHIQEHPIDDDYHRKHVAALLAAKALYYISGSVVQWVVFKRLMENKGFEDIAAELGISRSKAWQHKSRDYLGRLKDVLRA